MRHPRTLRPATPVPVFTYIYLHASTLNARDTNSTSFCPLSCAPVPIVGNLDILGRMKAFKIGQFEYRAMFENSNTSKGLRIIIECKVKEEYVTVSGPTCFSVCPANCYRSVCQYYPPLKGLAWANGSVGARYVPYSETTPTARTWLKNPGLSPSYVQEDGHIDCDNHCPECRQVLQECGILQVHGLVSS
jgi:hypothetical protein